MTLSLYLAIHAWLCRERYLYIWPYQIRLETFLLFSSRNTKQKKNTGKINEKLARKTKKKKNISGRFGKIIQRVFEINFRTYFDIKSTDYDIKYIHHKSHICTHIQILVYNYSSYLFFFLIFNFFGFVT